MADIYKHTLICERTIIRRSLKIVQTKRRLYGYTVAYTWSRTRKGRVVQSLTSDSKHYIYLAKPQEGSVLEIYKELNRSLWDIFIGYDRQKLLKQKSVIGIRSCCERHRKEPLIKMSKVLFQNYTMHEQSLKYLDFLSKCSIYRMVKNHNYILSQLKWFQVYYDFIYSNMFNLLGVISLISFSLANSFIFFTEKSTDLMLRKHLISAWLGWSIFWIFNRCKRICISIYKIPHSLSSLKSSLERFKVCILKT